VTERRACRGDRHTADQERFAAPQPAAPSRARLGLGGVGVLPLDYFGERKL
jgi:hypothetical protein